MSRWVLSIDPGSHTGLSLFENGEFRNSLACSGESFLSIRDAMLELFGKLPVTEAASKQAVLECGFIGPSRAGSLKLERRRGLAQAAAESLGFSVAELFPVTWQSRTLRQLGDSKPGSGRIRSAEWKRRALKMANSISPAAITSSDCADAICLGYCYSHDLHLDSPKITGKGRLSK